MSRSLMLVAVQALLISGCYTYRSVTKDDQGEISAKNEEAIRVTLKDGSVIESPPFMHILTREQSDLIIGTGQERSTSRTFKGLITSSEIDSTRPISTADGEALVCWLKNKTSVAFKPREYLRLTMEDSPGLWCLGERKTPGVVIDFRGVVPRDQIEGIEVVELNSGNTLKLAAGIALLPVAVFILCGVFAVVAWFARGL